MLHLSKSHSRVTSFIDDVEDVSRVGRPNSVRVTIEMTDVLTGNIATPRCRMSSGGSCRWLMWVILSGPSGKKRRNKEERLRSRFHEEEMQAGWIEISRISLKVHLFLISKRQGRIAQIWACNLRMIFSVNLERRLYRLQKKKMIYFSFDKLKFL